MSIDPVSAVIALVAVSVAIWANAISRRAVKAAEVSAQEAKRSADAADEANLLAKEARQQALEHSDVEWQVERSGVLLSFRNIGQTTAYAVVALVRVNDVRFDIEAGDIETDAAFECDTGAQVKAAHDDWIRTMDSMNQAGIGYIATPRFDMKCRISWQTASGVPHITTLKMK